jgi:hypothetical protein
MCGLDAHVATHSFMARARCFCCDDVIDQEITYPCFTRNETAVVLGPALHVECHELFIAKRLDADDQRRATCAAKIAAVNFLGDSRCHIAGFLNRLTRLDTYEIMLAKK